MMRKLLVVFACLLLSGQASFAQAVCGFDAVHAQKLASDPAYAAKVQQNISGWIGNQTLGNLSQILQTAAGPVYEIPVVIHVIRPTASNVTNATNPSDAQLIGMINYLNQTYAAQYTGYPDSNNGGTAFPIRFVLAKRDPNCAPTTGILRIDGSGLPDYVSDGITTTPASTPGEDDGVVKALSTWPVSRYYNIYIVNKIDGQNPATGPFTAGYAFFPNGTYTDATVMLASQAMAGEITLPHEIGHAFSLYHTFEGDGGGNACPTNANCITDGDLVCDTDPHKRSVFNCPTGINPCTNTSFGNVVHNFMDYSNCQDRFTPGQRTRFLFSVLNDRPGLANSLAGVAPPAVATTAATCNPTMISPAGTLNAGPVKVSFAGIVSQSQGGYVTDGNVVYSDLTCAYTGNLRVGTSYPISILTTSPNSKVRVWIDLNNDGVFASPGELILNVGNNTNNSSTFNGSWTVPATITTCTNLRMRVIVDRSTTTTIGSCATLQNGQAEDYTVYARPAIDTPVIALAANSTNPSCAGSPLTFNVTVPIAATSPSYRWYRNNTLQASTSNTFTSSALANGDRVRCWVKYTGPCGADSLFSNTITVIRGTNVTTSVSLALTAGSNPGCPNQSVTFTATSVNGGTAPTFAFRVNGATVQSGSSNTFTTTTLTNGSVVTVRLTSNSTCATPTVVTSSGITYTYGLVTVGVTVAQTAGTNPGCDGKPVTFTATPANGGSTPVYTWLVNGASVQTGSSATFTYQPVNGDVVRAVLTSSNTCVVVPNDTSASITLVVDPALTPAVSIALTKGSNPGCRDSLLEFTATTTNLTTTPAVKWYVNGVATANTNPFTTTTLSNGDVVYAVASSNGPGCRTVDSATSATITLRIDTPATPVTISYIAGDLIASSASIQWYGPSGIIAGATGATYHPRAEGYYYAVATNGACPSPASNVLLISTLTVGKLDLSAFALSPNPTTGNVTLSCNKSVAGLVSVEVYNSLGIRVHSEHIESGIQAKTVSLEALANGTYFFVLRNTAGAAGTLPVILRR